MAIPRANRFAQMTADGNSASVQWGGGRGTFQAWGTWGSGTLTLQMSPNDGTTWFAVDRGSDTYCTLSANSAGGFELPKCLLRVNLAGSTDAEIDSGVHSSHQVG